MATMELKEKDIQNLYEKCIEAAQTQGKSIDFLEVCKNAERGELRNCPLDDDVIMAFDVKEEELNYYMHPIFAGCHWSAILEDILVQRGILNDRDILGDLKAQIVHV
ncbi:MAG: hypothetical protein FWC13_13515 [Oscillospiraceae bacterium]|nr:hypothetical protein [Oscillospiraceae bacterium]